jgi:esterase/lipase
MLRFLKWSGTVTLVVVLGVAATLIWGPVTKVDLSPNFNQATIGADLDLWLEKQEQAFPDIVPRTEKQVIWAGAKGAKTPVAIVYLHGFSGSAVDIKPVPDLLAKELGANLFYTRLTGHGLDGAALGAATPESWILDTAEALAVGRRLGDKVLVIGTSTGGTLAAIAAADSALSEDIAGVVLISPNFRMKPTKARIFDLGYAPIWAPWLTGPEYSTTPTSRAHEMYWTNTYPISALFNVAALLRAAHTLDLTRTEIPLLVFYSPDDQVVDASYTASFLRGWGGPSRWEERQMTDQDDPRSHMITGDIRSPAQSESTVAIVLDWENGLRH